MDVDGARGICLFKLKQTALIPAYILLISETKLRLQAKQITGPPRVKNRRVQRTPSKRSDGST